MAMRLRLGEILTERGLTQKEFAKMCGLSENSISKLVNQPTQIKLATIQRICKALEIEVDDLIIHA